jgi:NodT family efflux transporter outer membrane factor (OMF) lipoprotein
VHDTHRAGLALAWEIDLWGRLAQTRQAASRDAQAAEEDLRGAWLLLESGIVASWVQLRLLEAAAPHHRARAAAAQRALALHQARVEAGLETTTAVHLARMAGLRIEGEALANRRALLQERQRLAMLVGQRPGWAAPPGPVPDLPDLPAGLDASMLEARPDLRAAERRWAAAASRVGEARAARLPRFTLTGAYGLASDELRNLGEARSVTWSLLPGLSLPLLDGGRSRMRVEAARAEALEARAEYDRVRHRALHEVAAAFRLLEEDRRALEHWSAMARDTDALLRARSAEHQAGRIGGLPLAETEQEHHGSVLQALEARGRLARTRVSLQLALGRPWEPGLAPGGWSAGPAGSPGEAPRPLARKESK